MSESQPRSQVRFREREAARLAKAIRTAGGGELRLDPQTGIYTVTIPGEENAEADTGAEWDAATKKLKASK